MDEITTNPIEKQAPRGSHSLGAHTCLDRIICFTCGCCACITPKAARSGGIGSESTSIHPDYLRWAANWTRGNGGQGGIGKFLGVMVQAL